MAKSHARRARARIVDVAQLASVSAQTVSNVINNRGRFTDDTRARVEAAIAELGFQPNRYAQSLRSQRTMLLGFDMSHRQLDASNPFTVWLLRELVHAASGHGYRIIAFTHEQDEPDDFRATAAAGAVDGFVLSDSTADDPRCRILAEVGVPFVVMGRTAPDLPQSWVDIDNREAISLAVDHLVEGGHTHIGYVGHLQSEYWDHERHQGAQDRLREKGIELHTTDTIFGTQEAIREPLTHLLSRADRPTALITSSDAIAVVVINVAGSLGLRVGTDLAVTGFDGGPLRTMTAPTLTSVQLPIDLVAETLLDRLINEITGHAVNGGQLVSTRLAIGGSS